MDFEKLLAGIRKNYEIKYVPLDAAKTEAEIQLGGMVLYYWTDGDLSNVNVKLNNRDNDAIPLNQVNFIPLPFQRLFLSSGAQSGKTLWLLVSKIPGLITPFNIGSKYDIHPRDVARRLVGGDLASDGVQWSAAVDTVAADTLVEIFSKTISEAKPGTLIEVEFGLTAAFKAVSSATADLGWKWQARDSGGTWVDLHALVYDPNIGITYVERTMSGYFTLVANFDALPFDIRLILQCSEVNEGRAKVKNSSYVRFIYKPS